MLLSSLWSAAVIATVWAGPTRQARETLEEAAYNVKKLVHEVTTGTMASVYPDGSPNAGHPFALMEYHAPCHPSPALTMVMMPISQSTHNILASDTHSATYTVTMPNDHVPSPMSRERVAFIGNITVLDYDEIPQEEREHLEKCYKWYHPDAAWWLPYRHQRLPHEAFWARFEPQDIYYVGGFGDTHYIGHIPVDLYAKAGEGARAVPDYEGGMRIQG